jgi:large subunit ribosomal protein L31
MFFTDKGYFGAFFLAFTSRLGYQTRPKTRNWHMKQGIHPDYHKIVVQMTDGTKYDTYSTWGKEGDVLQLDVDPLTHPAWVGGVNLRKTGQMEKFANKFGNLSMKSSGKKSDAPPAAKKDKKEDKKDA